MSGLTDTEIKRAKTTESAYSMGDGGGLYLWVKPTGGKQQPDLLRVHPPQWHKLHHLLVFGGGASRQWSKLFSDGQRKSAARYAGTAGRLPVGKHRPGYFNQRWNLLALHQRHSLLHLRRRDFIGYRSSTAGYIAYTIEVVSRASRSGFKPGTNVGAGCSCHPTGWHHHRSTRVPLHPVWPRPVARFPVLILESSLTKWIWMVEILRIWQRSGTWGPQLGPTVAWSRSETIPSIRQNLWPSRSGSTVPNK